MLPFGPERMLQRVVRLVGEVVSPELIVVVAAPGQELPPLPAQVTVAYDTREGRGPLEGLARGIQSLEQNADAVFATGCDVPLLVPAFVERMFSLLGDHDIVVPTDGKFHHPLAAVYRTTVQDHVQELLDADQLRPFFLFDKVNTRQVPINELRSVDPELTTLENLNRPEDYLKMLELAGFTPSAEVLKSLC